MPFNTGVVVASWKGGIRKYSEAVTNQPLQPAPLPPRVNPRSVDTKSFETCQTKYEAGNT